MRTLLTLLLMTTLMGCKGKPTIKPDPASAWTVTGTGFAPIKPRWKHAVLAEDEWWACQFGTDPPQDIVVIIKWHDFSAYQLRSNTDSGIFPTFGDAKQRADELAPQCEAE